MKLRKALLVDSKLLGKRIIVDEEHQDYFIFKQDEAIENCDTLWDYIGMLENDDIKVDNKSVQEVVSEIQSIFKDEFWEDVVLIPIEDMAM